MPEIAYAEVVCCVCGQLWDARDPGITYHSIDHNWWCTDDQACLEWASRAALLAQTRIRTDPQDMAAMYAALTASFDLLWDKMGWNT